MSAQGSIRPLPPTEPSSDPRILPGILETAVRTLDTTAARALVDLVTTALEAEAIWGSAQLSAASLGDHIRTINLVACRVLSHSVTNPELVDPAANATWVQWLHTPQPKRQDIVDLIRRDRTLLHRLLHDPNGAAMLAQDLPQDTPSHPSRPPNRDRRNDPHPSGGRSRKTRS